MAFEKFREEWSDMDPKFRWILIAVVALGVVVIGVRAMQPDKPPPVDLTKSAPMIGADGSTLDPNRLRLLPDTPRNQGIDDLTLKVAQLAERIDRSDKGQGGPRFGGGADGTTLPSSVAVAASAAAAAAAARSPLPAGSGATPPPIDLGSSLPPNFDAPGAGNAPRGPGGSGSKSGLSNVDPGLGNGSAAPTATPVEPAPARMKIWPAETSSAAVQLAAAIGGPVVPVNSALESVMLSGINARPSGSIGGAVGSVNSANKVGAPFVTRIKGEAIMPNG